MAKKLTLREQLEQRRQGRRPGPPQVRGLGSPAGLRPRAQGALVSRYAEGTNYP